MRVTAERLAVLRAVSCRPQSNAEEVAEYVRGAVGTISRQAVYDALAVLTAYRLVLRMRPGGRRRASRAGSLTATIT